MKRVIGFVGIFVCLVAVHDSRTQGFARNSLALNNSALFRSYFASPLWNNSSLDNPFTLAWTVPGELPSASDLSPTKNFAAPASPGRTLSERIGKAVPKFDYATAEIGFLYGRSIGKYDGDFKQAYLIGETGNDKTHIFVGASYEDSSLRLRRSGR